MQNQKNKQFGTRYWVLDELPAGVSAWCFKGNRIAGNQPYHSFQPNPSGLTLRIITAGEWTVKMNNQVMQAEYGDIFCAYPDVLIEFYSNSLNWEWYEIQFTGPEARAILSSFGCNEKQAVFSPERKSEALTIFKDIYHYITAKNHSVWQMQSLVCRLLDACNPSQFSEQSKKSSREVLVERVMDLIETEPVAKMNISELAEIMNIDRTTLRRAFLEQVNMNPIDFIQKIRIEHSQELLQLTDWSLKEIAHSTGFSNVKYFIRCFKKATGKPPRQWEMSHR